MRLNKTKILTFTIVSMFSFMTSSYAAGSGAFRVELSGSEALAKGSAFVGEADNPSAVYYNPAGLTQLKGKNYLSAGFSVLAPSASHTDFAGNKTQMTRQNFLIPHIYLVSDLGSENFVFGLGGTSNWGSATAWADDSFSKYVATKSDLFVLDSMVTASFKANDQWSFGVSADSAYSTLNKSKKLLQLGEADGDFNLKAKDTGWGYRLAAHFKLTEEHKFGLMYRSPIQLKYRGKVFLHELNTSGNNLFGIFGGDSFETAATAELELPQSVVFGYSYQPQGKWLFNFDVEWMDWSSVEQDLVEYPEVLTANQAAILNAGNPAPSDYRDAWSAGLGVEYAWSDAFRLRGGTYYHTTPIPDENLNSNLPGANSFGFTTGFGYDINKNTTFDLAYSALVFEDRTIDNAVGNSAGGNIDGEFEQIIQIGMVTFTYGF